MKKKKKEIRERILELPDAIISTYTKHGTSTLVKDTKSRELLVKRIL